MPVLERPQPTHLREALGDTLTLTLAFQDSTGAAQSKSGSTWRAHVRESPAASSTVATFSVDTSGAASGEIVCTLAAATSATMTAGRAYYYDVEETTSGGAVYTHVYGTVTWDQDVSRA